MATKITGDSVTTPQLSSPQITIGVVGDRRNMKAYSSAAGYTLNFTADRHLLEDANGNMTLRKSVNVGIDLRTVGLNGTVAGQGPVSGYVAVYHIWNPTTGVDGTIGLDYTSAIAPELCPSASLPAGFTFSALMMVWPTNSGRQFINAQFNDRSLEFTPVNVAISGVTSGWQAQSISVAVPPNANSVNGLVSFSNGTTSICSSGVASDVNACGAQTSTQFTNAASAAVVASFTDVSILTPQTIYCNRTAGAGTLNPQLSIDKYYI